MQISENKLVTLEYKLFVKNSNGIMELMEETTEENPLKYFHGIGMMMPKFEELIAGKNAGENFEFSIASADAYGEYSKENIIELPHSVFAEDGEIDRDRIFKGAVIPLIDSTGQRINADIVSVNENTVTVDLNHPLAGEDLFFKGKIIDVHFPTEEELQALTSCNCGSCNCSANGCGNCGK
ncbi:MAG: FKBP-type peptidyl-prolyl cis-trans isomerase [Prevotellaceae bacterium]|jgi:FKBP-type peptidyl-prolyl cis-trans isomerase SlyD|nr:FKBP-type peptidyl-prolyl cis-trans isomerase [Prevotellaceae bacterium]